MWRRVVLSTSQILSRFPYGTPDLEGMLPDSCPLVVQVFWLFVQILLSNPSVFCVLNLKSTLTLAALRVLPHTSICSVDICR